LIVKVFFLVLLTNHSQFEYKLKINHQRLNFDEYKLVSSKLIVKMWQTLETLYY